MTHTKRALPVLLVCAAVALLAPGVQSGPAAAPPFPAGTTWSYKLTMTKDGQTKVGTATETYRGLSAYGGGRYHEVEQSYSLLPGFVQRNFLAWDGRGFRQVAFVETDGKNTAEIVLDKSIPLGAQDASSGSAKVIVNGAQQGSVPWSFTSVTPGTESVTVPAGSFRAVRWDAVLRLGALESRLVVHTVGITDVRAEADQRMGGATQATGGATTVTIIKELRRGPIR